MRHVASLRAEYATRQAPPTRPLTPQQGCVGYTGSPTSTLRDMEREPPPAVHLDPSTAAGVVSLRFDRWFAEHQLDLPAETRAQFVEMGMQALERWPDRSSSEVLDELIDELDGRLARIVDETTSRHESFGQQDAALRVAGDDPPASRSGILARLVRRRDRPH